MTGTFERLQTALHRRTLLTGMVSFVSRLESGTVLGICYEGVLMVIPADELKMPERLIGTDIDFIVMAIEPDANIAIGCGVSLRCGAPLPRKENQD